MLFNLIIIFYDANIHTSPNKCGVSKRFFNKHPILMISPNVFAKLLVGWLNLAATRKPLEISFVCVSKKWSPLDGLCNFQNYIIQFHLIKQNLINKQYIKQ